MLPQPPQALPICTQLLRCLLLRCLVLRCWQRASASRSAGKGCAGTPWHAAPQVSVFVLLHLLKASKKLSTCAMRLTCRRLLLCSWSVHSLFGLCCMCWFVLHVLHVLYVLCVARACWQTSPDFLLLLTPAYASMRHHTSAYASIPYVTKSVICGAGVLDGRSRGLLRILEETATHRLPLFGTGCRCFCDGRNRGMHFLDDTADDTAAIRQRTRKRIGVPEQVVIRLL